ncbi:DNA-binding transcriptional activator BglJ [Klebsiella indica]|nr:MULTISPECIES: DNA-binding transcriptional activator BglJ [Klebsiella]
MENNHITRYIAVVEKCTMTEVALHHILMNESDKKFCVRFFKDTQTLKQAFKSDNFSAIIFSLSGNRRARLESLLFLNEVAHYYPEIQRIVLANDEAEMRLIVHLVSSRLHGLLNKSACRIELQERLLQILNLNPQVNAADMNPKTRLCHQILSPMEHTILRYMSYGYSLAEIATQLKRNIKTIRAHKSNAMTKLGVSSDMGLLSAADILLRL